MIRQIIADLRQMNPWYGNGEGYHFHIPHGASYQIATVQQLLTAIGVESVIQNDKILSIPDKDIVLDLMHSKIGPVTQLVAEYDKYNDISAGNWNRLRKYLKVKLDDEQMPVVKIESDTHRFLTFIRDNLPHTASAIYLIHEFLNTYSSNKNTPLIPNKLTIDMRPSTGRWLQKRNTNGSMTLAANHMDLLRGETALSLEIPSTFLHELRHILQYRHQLIDDDISNECLLSTQNLIALLAAEAEAIAHDLVAWPFEDYIRSVVNACQDKIENDVLTGKIKLPLDKNSSIAQKLSATVRFIEAKTEKNSTQILAQCFLAPARIQVYQILKSNGITLNMKSFHQLVSFIDEWKEHYIINPLVKRKFKIKDEFNPQEMKNLENRWFQYNGYQLRLQPENIFSQETAECLGIKFDNATNIEVLKPVYQYVGITDEIVNRTSLCYEQQDLNEIIRIYRTIQKENPILPDVNILLFHTISTGSTAITTQDYSFDLLNRNESFTNYLQTFAKTLCIAIEQMQRGKNLTTVLQTLGFSTNDTFIISLKERVTEHKQSLNRKIKQTKQKIRT